MHSLKNTVVAVCLLGLSFVFYQASSQPTADDADKLVSASGITDSADLAQTNSQATQPLIPEVEPPATTSPVAPIESGSQTTSDIGDEDSFNPSQFPPIGDQAPIETQAPLVPEAPPTLSSNEPASPSSFEATDSHAMAKLNRDEGSDFVETSPSPNSFAPPANEFVPPANEFSPLSNSAAEPPKFPKVTQLQPPTESNNEQRLVEALQNQNQWQRNQFVAGNADSTAGRDESGFTANQFAQPASSASNTPVAPAVSAPDNQFSSATQPIAANDSSFNELATDSRFGARDLGVIQAGSQPDPETLNFQAVWPEVDRLIANEKFLDAHRLLSNHYRSDHLTGPQRQRLVAYLDALAGKVIFSEEHHLSPTPYTVANETLSDLGRRWRVPAKLIYNINRKNIGNPASIPAGTQLKEIKGPFRAEIDLQQSVMTLFLNDLYATRFPIRVGISGNPQPSVQTVLVKSAEGHSWRDADGNEYPPGSPENGYGPHWIGLSGHLCIHAVDDDVVQGHNGCIGLNPTDAKDLFGILTEGSTVKIIR